MHFSYRMKTQNYILFLLAAWAGSVYAAPRTVEQARALAESFLAQRLSHTVQLQEASCMQMRAYAQGTTPASVPFYAFNDASGQGFALISGSDLMPEVLGYAEQGQLPTSSEALPENMQGWLNYIAQLEAYLEQNPSAAVSLQRAQATEPIPHLMNTIWDQDSPFNDLCPTKKNGGRTVTGCMATSISQVLKYQQFPTQMTGGTYSYKDNGNTRSVNFDEVTVDYSLLLDDYSRGKGTEEERTEVAKLLRNVGHAVNMQYGEMSGAITEMGLRGLIESIGCTKAQYLLRQYYSLDEWNDLIQTEIRSNRPVVFNGHSSEGGHSFVLDGVDENGFYYVNWGWSGYYNGYFDVSILLPSGYGAGASASDIGYVYNQSLYVNICDPDKAGAWHTGLMAKNTMGISVSKTTSLVGEKVTFSTTVLNENPKAFKGNVGVVLYKDGEVIDRAMSTTTISIDPIRLKSNNYGGYEYTAYGEKKISYSYTIPELVDGTYRLYMCAQLNDSEEYDLIHVNHSRYSYRTLIVADGKVTIQTDKVYEPIVVTGWNFDQEPMFTRPSDITAQLTNDGVESVAQYYSLELVRPDGVILDEIKSGVYTIAPGQTQAVSFNATLALEGRWKAIIYAYDAFDANANSDLIDEGEFDVSLDPTRGAIFSVAKKLELLSETLYSQGPAEFQITLNNTGATYDGQMAVRLYSSKTSTAAKYLIAEIVTNVAVPANASQEEVQISGDLNITSLSADKATLYARPYYLYGDEMVQLSNGTTQVTLYKGQSPEGIECIMTDEEPGVQMFDLMGRRINTATKGIRIVNGEKQIKK